MSVCPNKGSQEWKDLVDAVGLREAYRDFFETEGLIRTADEVLNKLSSRTESQNLQSLGVKLEEFNSFIDVTNHFSNNVFDGKTVSQDKINNDTALLLVEKMSKNLGVDYQIVTESEARALTERATNPWDGQPGFFYNNKVYLIRDKFTLDTAFHEFSHPFVRGLANENPQVFNNLYNELESTVYGRAIIESVKQNKALKPGSDLFKEEVLVRALSESAKNSDYGTASASEFKSFIAKLLFALRQFFRRAFAKKISISGLDATTTISELAEILSSEISVDLSSDYVTLEDVVAYTNETVDSISSALDSVDNAKIVATVNNFNDLLKSNIRLFKNSDINDVTAQGYAAIAELVYNEGSNMYFMDMQENLRKWQVASEDEYKELTESVDESSKRTRALVETVLRLNKAMGTIKNAADVISQNPDTQEAISKLHYFDEFAKGWLDVVTELKEELVEVGTLEDNVFYKKVDQTLNYLNQTINSVSKVREEVSVDVIYDQLRHINENAEADFKTRIEERLEAGDSPSVIDKMYQEFYNMTKDEYDEYTKLINLKGVRKTGLTGKQSQRLHQLNQLAKYSLSITKEKVRETLRGEMGDAGWFNSYTEGYLYNSDPVIGGLALYIKNKKNEAMMVINRNANEFARDTQKLLQKYGYDAANQYKLRDDMGFKDKVYTINPETKKGEVVEVYSFLHEFKDYRSEIDQVSSALREAQDELILDPNNAELNEKVKEAQAEYDSLQEFMHREYTSEVYDIKNRFAKDAIGMEAFHQRSKILEKIKEVQKTNRDSDGRMVAYDEESLAEVDQLWRDYAQLYTLTDLRGKSKSKEKDPATGISPYEIAVRLREYRTESRKYYYFQLHEGAFDKAYTEQVELLKTQFEFSEDPNSDFQTALQFWVSRNTTVKLKDEYYDKRDAILDSIKELLSKLDTDTQAELDKTDLFKKLFDITAGFKDEAGEISATNLTPEALAEIKDIQDQLEDIKNKTISVSGLTPVENVRLSYLFNLKENITDEELYERRSLLNKKNKKGLNESDRNKLFHYYDLLSEMSDTLPTEYYLDIMNNYFDRFGSEEIIQLIGSKGLNKANANIALNPAIINPLLNTDPEFKQWFDANHRLVMTSVKSPLTGEISKEERYQRTFAWNVQVAKDINMHETFEIKSEGRTITILGAPNLSFHDRKVKPEYINRRVVNETIDNMGNFLPKSRSEMEKSNKDNKFRFINERYEKMKNDPSQKEKFELLEKLKENHLKFQESSSYANRLYMDMPRYNKDNLEIIQGTTLLGKGDEEKPNFFKYQIERLKEFKKKNAENIQSEGRTGPAINWTDELNLVRADMIGNKSSNIPVTGLYNIPIDDVSPNILTGMLKYMGSIEQENKLIEASPIIRSIQDSVGDVKTDKVNRTLFNSRKLVQYLPSSDNIRRKAVDNLIERELEGKNLAGVTKDWVGLQKSTNLIFKASSFSFFAMNIPSALKNSLGMKFQALILAAGGEDLNYKSFIKGRSFSTKTMAELSFGGGLTQKGAKTLNQQMVDNFDMIQDRSLEKLGDTLSRSMTGDLASFSWINSPRKWVELEAGINAAAGMLYKRKVIQKINGSEKEIPYLEAFELDSEGIMKLKDGIDVTYASEKTEYFVQEGDTLKSIAEKFNTTSEVIEKSLRGKDLKVLINRTQVAEKNRTVELDKIQKAIKELDQSDVELYTRGLATLEDNIKEVNKKYDQKIKDNFLIIDNSNFKNIKNRMHQVTNDLGGAYAKFDQPEASRYILFRMFSFMRKYFTTMFSSRFAFAGGNILKPRPRLNPGKGTYEVGFYVKTLELMINTLKEGGKNLGSLTPEEKAAFLKFTAETVYLLLLSLAASLMGYDDEDDDRFKKLERKSGPLPFLGMTKGKYKFDALGWLEVHSLHMIMQVRSENEQFSMLGGLGGYTDLLEAKSIAIKPTIGTYINLLTNMYNAMTGDKKAKFTRNMGPYAYQKKGSYKFISDLARPFGLTGSSLDPIKSIKNLEINR